MEDINELFKEQLELEAKQARIAAAILEAQTTGKQNAIAQIEDLIQKYKISFQEIPTFVHEVANKKKKYKPRNPQTSKKQYLNPSTGETWSGIGRRPEWLKYAESPEALLVVENKEEEK